ncbi:hypothetical protein EBT25_12170 [bacterium]|nr:hypothetical protein [bacterium]
MTKDLFLFVLLQSVLRQSTKTNSYTGFNCVVWLLTVALGRREWWPLVFCNTMSLTGTFYMSGFVIDRTFFRRMREVHKMSMRKFVLGDLCVHLLPTLWLIWSLAGSGVMRREWRSILRDAPVMRYCGLYSLMLNLLWAAMYNFEIGGVYVPNSVGAWYCKWMVCAALHIISGNWLAITV